jgi:transcription initiation factor TFIIIB Brf1 subunit/transcription initiation factor TFIIB|tara:strand:+ start:22511 stop:22726 length:216 start_codon:yes stop_codon:yes gene_type:complete
MDLIKVDGHSGLARDKKTGAILNINSTEIDRIKELRKNQREFKNSQAQEINQLKSDVSEIKMMLSKLIEKL